MGTYQPPRRPLQTPYYGKHLIFFPSRKNQRLIACHSALEADYCVHLEYETLVVSYECQPGPFDVDIAGRPQPYTPDFRVETTEEVYFTEVKIDFSQASERTRLKLEAARHYFAREGSSLAYADLQSIRPGPRLGNLKFLYLHSFNLGADEYGACLRLLSELRYPISMRELFNHAAEVRERAIYKALFERRLECDLSHRLTLDTSIVEARHEHHRT